MMSNDNNMKYNIPPRGYGLVFKCSIDNKWGGIYFNYSKFRVEFCLGFLAFRVFFMSEEHYDALQTIVTHNKICTSHKISLKD